MARSQPVGVSSNPTSRSSSLRRSHRPDSTPSPTSSALPKIAARRTRSSLGMASANIKTEDAKEELLSRASVSSTSTVNDYGENSGYTTGATSVVATPIETRQETVLPKRGRGRPRLTATATAPIPGFEAMQKAKRLRNSEYTLNPSNNKRKRSDFEEANDDLDESADAQLARALQEEEDARGATMDMDDDIDMEELAPRRTRRSLRAILPKTDYASGFSDEETDIKSNSKVKKLTVQKFKKTKVEVEDSEESEFTDSDVKTPSETASRASSDDDLDLVATTLKKEGNIEALRFRINAIAKGTLVEGGQGRLPMGKKRTSENFLNQTSGSSSKAKDVKKVGGSRATTKSTPKWREGTTETSELSELSDAALDAALAADSEEELQYSDDSEEDEDEAFDRSLGNGVPYHSVRANHRYRGEDRATRRAKQDRDRLEQHHPELLTMWKDLENLPEIKAIKAEQPTRINRALKPFQLEGLSWMQAMEKTAWGGGLLGDEMGMGKTIQAVSLIMSDYPAKQPSLVLIPPVALMQWQQEIGDYTDGTIKTFVFHGTNLKSKNITVKELKQYDVILMSYNSLESMYRHQEKGFKRKEKVHFEKSVIHQIQFHRVILDEAHNIKQRTTGVAKACFALKADHKWCLSGTPLQNRIGEFFSLVRFLDIRPFACYMCKQCPCTALEWSMNSDNRCTGCKHSGMQHVSVFNQELLNPIVKYGNKGLGKVAFGKLRLLTDRFMLRRVKRDHSASMELPAKEIHVDRQFFGEEENDFAGSIMNNGTRKFETYVAQGVLLNNYANIFGLIMQMRQVADHPDLILKKNSEGGQNVLVCCICDEPAEDAIRSSCKHDFCRQCVKSYLSSSQEANSDPDCPRCHILLAIDLEQQEMEQDEQLVKKSSIINRIKMENWTSSSKIETLVYDLHALRSNKSSTKSIIFSQFTTMLQLVEWRLRRAGITTVMLDGSMTPAQRQASINHFMTDVNVEVFLVSLKAGGVALNLTEASKVFIVDPWWNPAAEWQSADRCHRIGQSRPCSITRLCIEDSVESRMVLLQEKKANMINSTINADDAAMESLTAEDMQFLFRGT